MSTTATYRFTQKRLRTIVLQFHFSSKEQLFNHEYFVKYRQLQPTFHRFSLMRVGNIIQVLGEYYGGTEWHILGEIEGDSTQLGVPFNDLNW